MEAIVGDRVTRAVGLLAASLLGALAAVSPAGPAAAHNSLTGSVPANGARVATAPAVVQLTFLAKLNPQRTKVVVTGPDNVDAVGGAPAFAGSKVTVPFRPGLAGLYIVSYEVGSADGHPVKGEVRFTLTTGTAAAPPTGTPSPGTSPGGAEPSGTGAPTSATVSGTPDAAPAPAASAGESGRGWLVGGLLVGLLLVAGVVGTLVVRRRRS
ncbi:copper resistance protein CopC [Plantactinospora sp. GCM10030261]|uniref:copper resistance CopC family protein n=1 Tax=Plantactinospora sp. GCM10030261 TaxID=3273420 RepID=UPI00361774CE